MADMEDGGPAFPQVKILPGSSATQFHYHLVGGLTKRDWFAGMAMQGWIIDPNKTGTMRDCAEDCYALADAMLAASEALR